MKTFTFTPGVHIRNRPGGEGRGELCVVYRDEGFETDAAACIRDSGTLEQFYTGADGAVRFLNTQLTSLTPH